MIVKSFVMNKTQKLTVYLILCLSFIVLFIPSSYQGVIFNRQSSYIDIIMFCMILIIGTMNYFSKEGIVLSTLGMSILFLATLTSKLEYIAFGGIPEYLVIFGLFSITLHKQIFTSKYIPTIFYFISGIIILYAYLFILDFQKILQINASYYQAIDHNLFVSMTIWHKEPVTFFASHSIAGYIYFAFLITHLKLFNSFHKISHRGYNLIFILAYMGLLILLLSNTSYILFVLSIVVVSVSFMRFHMKQTLPILIIICTVLIIEIYNYIPIIVESIKYIFLSHSNGLLSRYTAGGRLSGTYNYIAENIFRPIGFTYDASQIALGDNFIAEYIIKGGIFFYIIILFSLYSFLKRNLLNSKNIKYFMFFFLLSEIGYPLLVYYKTVGILLLLIMVWNHAALQSKRKV